MIQLWWGKRRRGTIYSIWSSAHNAGSFICVAVVPRRPFKASEIAPIIITPGTEASSKIPINHLAKLASKPLFCTKYDGIQL